MTYRSKVDVWMLAAIAFAWAVLLAGADRWIVTPMLVILMMCAYPESYMTTPAGPGGARRALAAPGALRANGFVGAAGLPACACGCRPGWQIPIAPAEPRRVPGGYFGARAAPAALRRTAGGGLRVIPADPCSSTSGDGACPVDTPLVPGFFCSTIRTGECPERG